MKSGNKGFIKLNLLLTLFIAISMLPLTTLIFKYSSTLSFDYVEIEDEIVLYKLRKIYLLSYDQEINPSEINFVYDNKSWNLSLINRHLLLSPGSQIFLEDVDYLEFYESNDLLHIKYTRGNKEYDKILSQAQRLCRDDFYRDDDGNIEPTISQ